MLITCVGSPGMSISSALSSQQLPNGAAFWQQNREVTGQNIRGSQWSGVSLRFKSACLLEMWLPNIVDLSHL